MPEGADAETAGGEPPPDGSPRGARRIDGEPLTTLAQLVVKGKPKRTGLGFSPATTVVTKLDALHEPEVHHDAIARVPRRLWRGAATGRGHGNPVPRRGLC